MDTNEKEKLKLIYVHKVGKTTKGTGLYEFIFSNDSSKIDVEEFGWRETPAYDNAKPPTEEYYDKIFKFQTDKFDLFCLHEAVDREYMHGYHNIHALAYEQELEDEDSYIEDIDDETPLLVFHYNMSLKQVEDLIYERGNLEPLEEVI